MATNRSIRLRLFFVVAILGAGLIAANSLQARVDYDPDDPLYEDKVLAESFQEFNPAWDKARMLEEVTLALDGATLLFHSGWFIPMSAGNEQACEGMFVGKATFTFKPANDIEAQQLELFSGKRTLEEPLTSAILTLTDTGNIALMLGGDEGKLDPETRTIADGLFEKWAADPMRSLLGIPQTLALTNLGSTTTAQTFTSILESEDLGRFLFTIDPGLRNPIELAHWKPIELSERQERKVRKWLHKLTRDGRYRDIDLDQLLGFIDTWSARSLPIESARTPQSAFESLRYVLDVTADPVKESIYGSATITVRARKTGNTLVARVNPALEIKTARDAEGSDLLFLQNAGKVHVLLPETVPEGQDLTLSFQYEGKLLARLGQKLVVLSDSIYWHPHVGSLDFATYDLTLRSRKRFQVLTSGKLIAEGEEDKNYWQRRLMDRPTESVSFEIGDYDIRRFQVGHVVVTLAFDRQGERSLERIQEEVIETIRSALPYYEKTFGPYPLDYLTVVSAARDYSQSHLGFVTISDFHLKDLHQFYQWLFGIADRRQLVAHELAHQWWGNTVGLSNSDDVWLSEAMANYSALLWCRENLPDEDQPINTLISRWSSRLLASARDGRPVESLGPIVLGARLDSSLSFSAYQSIVYAKGAVVLNTLSNLFGEEDFLKLLEEVVRVSSGKLLSTEAFFEILELASGMELDWFVDQFLYRTGIPIIYYSYEYEELTDGKWRVFGTAKQYADIRYRYGLIQNDEGWDVTRDPIDMLDIDSSALSVPVLVAVHDPSQDEINDEKRSRAKKRKKKEVEELRIDGTIEGRMLLKGHSYDFSMELPYQPVKFYLDYHKQVFGRFVRQTPEDDLDEDDKEKIEKANESKKKALRYEISHLMAHGQSAEAVPLLEKMLTFAPDDYDREYAYFRIARIHMDRGDLESAQAQLDKMDETIKEKDQLDSRRLVAARLALLRGDIAETYRVLTEKNKKDPKFYSLEGYAMLALAAQELQKDEMSRKVEDLADHYLIDFGTLKKAPEEAIVPPKPGVPK